MKVRLSNLAEKAARPSKVFGVRLREMRRARGLTQPQLAELMTAAGQPMNKAAVLRVENGERGLALDEAVTFAHVLHVPFANLLEPARDSLVALTNRVAVDGDGMRRWLVTGSAIPVWPAEIKTEADRDMARAYLADLAVALVRAAQGHDKAGVDALAQRINAAIVQLAGPPPEREAEDG